MPVGDGSLWRGYTWGKMFLKKKKCILLFGGWFEISVSTGGLKSALQWLHVLNDECAGGHFLHTWGGEGWGGKGAHLTYQA